MLHPLTVPGSQAVGCLGPTRSVAVAGQKHELPLTVRGLEGVWHEVRLVGVEERRDEELQLKPVHVRCHPTAER